jgi:hypothetical protein
MAKTKIVRHEIYDYLQEQGLEMTHERRAYLSCRIQEHSDNRAENLKKIATQHAFAMGKIATYLAKAKTMPASPTLKTQVDTLNLVHDWLTAQPAA